MKKILPPTLLLISIVIMIIIHFLLPIKIILVLPFNLLGICLLLVGIFISIVGSNKFERENTTVMTFNIPELLVVDGMYKYSRNPMYLGFVLMVIGVWVLLGSLSTIFVGLIFILLLDRYYIRFEEKVLHEKFGVAYMEYKKNVRRWI